MITREVLWDLDEKEEEEEDEVNEEKKEDNQKDKKDLFNCSPRTSFVSDCEKMDSTQDQIPKHHLTQQPGTISRTDRLK